jgi:hypothetical protein
MTPVAPLVLDGSYRRLAWQGTRTQIHLRVFLLLGFAPGVAAGLWLTREWNWPGATTVVAPVLGLMSALVLALLPVRDPSLKAMALVSAIEHYRTDEAARAEIGRPPPPQVVDTGTGYRRWYDR